MKPSSSPVWLRARFALILTVWVILSAGCGGGPPKQASLSGKVTYPTSNKPVTGGTIGLHPASGDGVPILTPLRVDGTFSIGGISPGPRRVTIETESVRWMSEGLYPNRGGKAPPGGEIEMPPLDSSMIPKYVPIPRRYADPRTTPLRWDIEAGAQSKEFILTGEK